MSGLNSLTGLNKVEVDFRPDVKFHPKAGGKEGSEVPNDAAGIQDSDDVNAGSLQRLQTGSQAKSVLQQLDVLLVNAAKRSVTTDAALKTQSMGATLQGLGVISADEAAKLAALAKTATDKLEALDKLTGLEIANAIEITNASSKTGGYGWSKTEDGALTPAAKAVKGALDAQNELSGALYDLKNRLYKSDKVGDALMDLFNELQFQCDRRATEINSVVRRMHELQQQDVVDGADHDPKIKGLLTSKFMDLMPREAIMMHGTAEAIELMQKTFGEQMRPLAEKLDAFAADHGKDLTINDITELQASMMTMRNAVANVRQNGIVIGGAKVNIDKSILQEMENVLAEVAAKIVDAKKHCAKNVLASFMDDARENMLPKIEPAPVYDADSPFGKYVNTVDRLIGLLRAHGNGSLTAEGLDAEIETLKGDIRNLNLKSETVQQVGYDAETASKMVETLFRLEIVGAQFKELVKSTAKFASEGPDTMVTTGDVRRMMLGELSVSSVVEARARGFKASDVNPKADDANIVDSKPFGSGQASGTYLLTTKNGEKFVFKPEFESRIGLSRLALGDVDSYNDAQSTVNLNIATQETAKIFGLEDMVVKYSVGCHNGQFGFFMEMAPGFAGSEFARKMPNDSEDCVDPAALMTEIGDPEERKRVEGQVAQQLNRLQWLDIITGQGDRHWGNYFIHIDKVTHAVSLKGIDNDASFSNDRTGVQTYSFSTLKSMYFRNALKVVCQLIYGRDRMNAEFNRCWRHSAAITHDRRTAAVTIDLSKVDENSREIAIALSAFTGSQTLAFPDAIDKSFYDKLMDFDKNPKLKDEYLATIAPRISKEALEAARMRLDDAIEHAKRLNDDKMVFDDAAWRNPDKLRSLTGVKTSFSVFDVNGNKTTLKNGSNQYMGKFLINICPSYYKRDVMNRLFVPDHKQ